MNQGLSLLATETAGDFYQFARLQAMSEWWHWLVLLAVCAAILAYVVLLYRRDSVELPRGTRWVLLVLRVLALSGILFYFFNLEKRTERKIVKNSRVLAAGRHQPEHGPAGRRGRRTGSRRRAASNAW